MSVPKSPRTVPSAASSELVGPMSPPPGGNRVLSLERDHDDRSGGHEGNQVLVERSRLVNGVEPLGLRFRQLQALEAKDRQSDLLDSPKDLTRRAKTGDGVGFDDGERPLDGHRDTSSGFWNGRRA